MTPQNIRWNKELSRKPKYRSTWGAEIDGAGRIVKKIEADDPKKLKALAKRLKSQVHFTGRQDLDEQKIVCLFDDMFEGDGFIAFCRKFRLGATLDSMISRKRFKPSEAVKICLETARVLQIAHAKRIYHGDLNPRNIIVGDGETISIIDWDSTIICDAIQKELIGPDVPREDVGASPEYMPPEQFRGDGPQPRTDVYALGVILYQMLCGHTPFDDAGANTPVEMGRYKEKHEPGSIRKAYPGLAIPDELDRLIEQSLKNDLKQRIPSIDVFIQRLREVKFDSESGATGSRASVMPPETAFAVPASVPASVPAATNEKEYKLVLIGHAGSGKTALTAGLYATHDRDFTVDEPGARTRIGAYIFSLKDEIENRKWPPATSINDIIHISCNLNYKGRQKCFAFDDYAGDRLGTDNFNDTLFPNPDGAFILLNPGAPQWNTPQEKNRMISDLKFYIDQLGKLPNKPPVALVITASDRLNSDRRNFAPVFEECVKELENNLTSRKCLHRTFRVTVSGKLTNQNRPELKPKGIKEPFIWMMERFEVTGLHRLLKRVAMTAGAVAAALIVAFAGEYFREAHNASSLKKDCQEIEKSFAEKGSKTKQDYLTHVMNLVDLRNRFCSEKHFSNAARLGECSSACRPSFFLSSIGISSFKNDFDNSIALLEGAIDAANCSYLSVDLDDALKNPTEENRKVAGRIEKWNPLRAENDSKKSELQRKCADEMPQAVELFDQRLLEKELLAIIDNPGTTFPPHLESAFRSWTAMESKRPKTEWDEAVETMKALELRARRAVENRRFETVLSRLNGIGDFLPQDLSALLAEWNDYPTSLDASERAEKDKQIQTAAQNAANRIFEKECEKQKSALDSFGGGSVDELAKLAKDYLAFWKDPVPGVEPGLLKNRRDELDQKICQVVADFVRAKQAEARTEIMESATFHAPAYSKEVKEKVTSQFSAENSGLARKMNDCIDGLVSEGEKEWDGAMKQNVDSFLAGVKDVSISEVLDRFREFSLKNSANPYFGDAEDAYVRIVEEKLDDLIRGFDPGGTKDDYESMNGIAEKIRSSPGSKLRETWMNTFANAFSDMMNADEHTLSVTDIQVSTSFSGGAYIEKLSYSIGEREPVVLIDDLSQSEERKAVFKDEMTTLPNFETFSVQCAPWEEMTISFNLWENRNWRPDSLRSNPILSFKPGKTKTDHMIYESDDLELNFYFQLNYKRFHDILLAIGKNDGKTEAEQGKDDLTVQNAEDEK